MVGEGERGVRSRRGRLLNVEPSERQGEQVVGRNL